MILTILRVVLLGMLLVIVLILLNIVGMSIPSLIPPYAQDVSGPFWDIWRFFGLPYFHTDATTVFFPLLAAIIVAAIIWLVVDSLRFEKGY